MKNMKKVIAAISAAAMTMSIGVSAFAASAEYDKKNAKVVLKDLAIDAEHQWTVVVISADKQDATLTAEDLYYINQGTNGETFWTNGLGTKVDLADGDHDGTYIVRIGGETITSAEDLVELSFTVSTVVTPTGRIVKFVFGDVNNGEYTGEATSDLSVVTAADAFDILNLAIGGTTAKGGVFNIGDVVTDNEGKKFVFGDVNNGLYTGEAEADLSAVTAADAFDILNLAIGGSAAKDGAYNIGDVVSVTVADAAE